MGGKLLQGFLGRDAAFCNGGNPVGRHLEHVVQRFGAGLLCLLLFLKRFSLRIDLGDQLRDLLPFLAGHVDVGAAQGIRDLLLGVAGADEAEFLLKLSNELCRGLCLPFRLADRL